MKVVVAPGSFKGSVHSLGAANEIARVLRREMPAAKVKKLVLADGGEGTLETFVVNFGAVLKAAPAMDPLGRRIRGRIATIGDTAIVQSCETVGLSLLKPEELKPLTASSYGVGEQIRHAVRAGARTVLVSMGDSAVLDFGLGMMAALGGRWLGRDGAQLEPTLAYAEQIRSIDLSAAVELLNGVKLCVLFDTYDYFCGDTGQVQLYGAQKGLSPEAADWVEMVFKSFAVLVRDIWGVNLETVKGSSGSGGIAGTMHAVLGAELRHTLEYLDELLHIRDQLGSADVVVTGEGRLDHQTKFGKVPQFVAESARGKCFHVVGYVTSDGAADIRRASALPHFVMIDPYLDSRRGLREAAEQVVDQVKVQALTREVLSGPYVVVLYGLSGAGKTTALHYLKARYEIDVCPKVTTRESRRTPQDIEDFITCRSENYPASDLISFQSYGHRFGIQRERVRESLLAGRSHGIIVGDCGAVHQLQLEFPQKVVVILMHATLETIAFRVASDRHRKHRMKEVIREAADFYDNLGCIQFVVSSEDSVEATYLALDEVMRHLRVPSRVRGSP